MAAEKGGASVQLRLAKKYAAGEGVRKDPEQAVKWYRRAAEQNNNPEAQWELGQIYLKGIGVPVDAAEGTKWVGRAGANGHKEANAALPRLTLIRDADRGEVAAQLQMGKNYDRGAPGFTVDKKEAAKWFTKAAGQGSLEAQLRLSEMCMTGEGLPQSIPDSVRWLEKEIGRAHV